MDNVIAIRKNAIPESIFSLKKTPIRTDYLIFSVFMVFYSRKIGVGA